jgi:hypothetical protein
MTQNCKRNIFLYNKQNELVTYVKFDSGGLMTGYYSLSDRVLTKATISRFKEKNKLYTDTNKSKITFKEDCKLFHMFFDQDDSYCRAIKRDSLRIEPPTTLSTIHSHNEDCIEGYTINPSLIQDWLKKL